MFLDLSIDEINIIQKGLFELPMKDVWQLNNKIITQVEQNKKEQTVKKAEVKKIEAKE